MDRIVDALQGFEFDVTAFLGPGRRAVTAEAVALCRGRGLGAKGLEERVSAFLDISCRQRMERSAQWTAPWRDIMDGSLVTARIGGVSVEARVALTPRRIRVRLVSPFDGAAASVRAVPGTPLTFTEPSRKGRSASDYGKQRIRSLVVSLYYDRMASSEGNNHYL